MASIIAEFDTVEKTLTVTKGGKKFKNVESVFMGKGYDEDKFFAELRTVTSGEGDDEGTMTITTLRADQNGKEIVEVKEETIEGKTHRLSTLLGLV